MISYVNNTTPQILYYDENNAGAVIPYSANMEFACMGLCVAIRITIKLNYSWTGAGGLWNTQNNIDWYFKPALFLPSGYPNSEDPANQGTTGYFHFNSLSSTTPSVHHNMNWVGNTNNKPPKCTIFFQRNTAGGAENNTTLVVITLYHIMQNDFRSYFNGSNFNNHLKLLRNEVNNTVNLDTNIEVNSNQTLSIYNTTDGATILRNSLWTYENAINNNNWSYFRINSAPLRSRFYRRGLDNLVMERIVDGSDSFELRRNTTGTPIVTDFSTAANTFVYHRITRVAGFTPATTATAYLISADKFDNAVSMINNYQMRGVTVPNMLSALATNYGIGNTSPSAVFGAPINSYINNIGGNNYEMRFEILASGISLGGKYRVIVIWRMDTNPTTSNYRMYSFISNEILVTDCIELTDGNIPDLSGALLDFNASYSGQLICTPQERITSQIDVDAVNYNLAYPVDFNDGLNSVRIRYYTEDAVNNRRHVYNDFTLTPLNTTTLGNAAYPLATYDKLTSRLTNKLRVRYEGNLLNQYSENLATNGFLSAESNMDWTSKTVIIETTFNVTQPTASQQFVYKQVLLVKDYVTQLGFTITDSNGKPIPQFCDDTDGLKVCVYCEDTLIIRACDNNTGSLLISHLDRQSFGITNLKEHENASSNYLSTIVNEAVISQDATFNNGVACTVFDEASLEEGVNYRYCAVVKEAMTALNFNFTVPTNPTGDCNQTGTKLFEHVRFSDDAQYQIGRNAFSLECWVRPDLLGVACGRTIFRKELANYSGANLDYPALLLQITTADTFRFGTAQNAAQALVVQSTPITNPLAWYHVVCVKIPKDANVVTCFIYVNGILASGAMEINSTPIGADTINTPGFPVSSAPIILGGDFIDTYGDGSPTYVNSRPIGAGHFTLAEMRWYNRALSATEIGKNYSYGCKGSPSNSADLLFYTRLNEISGTTVTELIQGTPGGLINYTLARHNTAGNAWTNRNC